MTIILLSILIPQITAFYNSANYKTKRLNGILSSSVATTNSLSYFECLAKQCQICVNRSLNRFTDDKQAADSKGTWIDQDQLQCLSNLLLESRPSPRSKLMEYIASAPVPVHTKLLGSKEFDITLLHVPRHSTFPARKHNPGTILLYKSVYGNGYIRTFIQNREIKYDVLEDEHLIRMGGTSRIFGSTEDGPAAMLEIALFPPRRDVEEGSDAVSGFEIDKDNTNILKLEILPFDVSNMFVSAEEFQTANLLYMDKTDDEQSKLISSLKENVGGLGPEIDGLIRRVLASRRLDSTVLESLGVSHVRGVLLHGPPGCGKTLIARQLARALNAREPKIVNGPEVLDKFVGEAERNIRNLFAEAEQEWALRGPESELHVVIFDELDSIAKTRGSLRGDGSGVRDSVVNQLLAILDGVRSLNNILVVGLTNRKELIDPALLRPGRLEVHVEIKLPDRDGREEILSILLKPMATAGHLFPSEDLNKWVRDLAGRTSGWSGADLTGLVRSAVSFAINRQQAFADAVRARGGVVGLGDSLQRRGSVVILWKDFERAFKEVSRPKNSRIHKLKEILKSGADKLKRNEGKDDSVDIVFD